VSDEITLTPNSGPGGMGDAPDGGDDGASIDALLTPQGPIEQLDDDGFGAADDQGDGDGGAGEWFDSLPEDLRDGVSKFRTPEDMARSYLENERRMGEFRSEIGSLRDEVANIASRRGPEGEGYRSEPQNDIPTMAQVAAYSQEVARAIDQGELDVGAGFAQVMEAVAGVSAAREEFLLSKLDERVAERTAPLEQDSFRTAVAREITRIKGEIGDETYQAHEPQVRELLLDWERQQPGFVQNARAVRAAFGEVLMRTQAQQRKEAGSRVLDRSGRGAARRAPSPAQAIVDEMDALNPGGYGGGL